MATRLILETSDGTDSVADSTDTEVKEREFRDVSQTLRYFAYKTYSCCPGYIRHESR